MSVKIIMSGGQTGADQGGWLAAEKLGIRSRGWMPAGFLTEDGPRPDFKERFSAVEHPSSDWPPRTRNNIVDSGGTIIFGSLNEPGSRLTARLCKEYFKHAFHVPFKPDKDQTELMEKFREWLVDNKIEVLNVAGNRESKYPGIQEFTEGWLTKALGGEVI